MGAKTHRLDEIRLQEDIAEIYKGEPTLMDLIGPPPAKEQDETDNT